LLVDRKGSMRIDVGKSASHQLSQTEIGGDMSFILDESIQKERE
jgi:hypothetical protein